ncbi:MAG: PAS domain-containing protein, partial [Acetobacteraceae bacterium]|nr:PAS domain-containing protein [Acetobacteraceae bacterium]
MNKPFPGTPRYELPQHDRGHPGPAGATAETPAASPLPRLRFPVLLLGLVLAVLLPALALGGAAAWQAVAGHQATAKGRLLDTARALALAADREIGAYRSAMAALAGSGTLDGPQPALDKFETEARRAAAVLGTSVILLDSASMRQLVNTALPPGRPVGDVSAGDFRSVTETGRPLVTDLVVGAVSRRPVVGIAVPVVRDGRIPFVLAARLEPERLHHLLAAQGLPEGAFAAVADSRNVLVARSDALHERVLGQPVPPENARFIEGREGGTYRGVAVDGVERVFGFGKLDAAPGWTVFIAQPAAAFDAAWRWPLLALAAGGLLALALGGASALFAARSVLVPVRRLSGHARALAWGAAAEAPAASAAAIPPAAVAELETLRRGFVEAEAAVAFREAAVAESEARFRAMADNIPQLAWMARPDGWIFWYNRRWHDYTGTALEEMQGWGWRTVHHPDHVGRVAAHFRRCVEAGEPWEDTFPLRGADGAYRWFLSRAEPVRDAGGRVRLWFGTNTDVTERRAAEVALAESSRRLRSVLDNLFAFVGVLAPDGTLLEANRAPLDAAGIAIEDVRGKPFWECVWWAHDPAEAARVREAVARAAAGEPSRFDAVVRMAGDSRMAIDFQIAPLRDAEGRIVNLIPSATDITARVAAQASLRDQEAYLRSVLDASNDCLKVVERDGTLSFMNANGRCLMEIDDGFAIEGREWADLWPEANRAQVCEAVAAALSGRPARFEALCPTPLGTPKWWDVAVAPVRDAEGRVARLVATSRDVSLRKAAEAGLRESEATLNAVLDALPVGVVLADVEGRIVRDNAASRELWGIPPGTSGWEVHGERVGWWPGTGERIRAQDWGMARALLKGEVVRDELVECARFGTGERRFFLNNAAPVRDAEGRIVAGVAAVLDVTERRATEAALAESEARLKLFIERAPAGIAMFDTEMRYLALSRRFLTDFGFAPGMDPAALVGTSHYELFRESPEHWRKIHDRVLAGETLSAEDDPFPRPDGRTDWLRWEMAPWRRADGSIGGALLFSEVVTGRVEAEQALAESEARLRLEAERVQLALAAGAIIGTWDWELPTDRFTVDERFALSFGLDPALGRTGLSLEQVIATVHPDDRPGLALAIDEAIRRGGPYSHEYRVKQRDGAYRWIEANGRVDHAPDGTPLRFPGVLLDVEARRTMQAERDRAAALLLAFVEAVPGVVYAKDHEGRMLVANEGTAALIGKRPEEFLGRTDAEFLGDRAQAEAVMANDRRIMEGGVAEQVEETVSLPDGTAAVWLSTKAPFRDGAGKVVGLIGSSVDITARKLAEERLRESEARLRLASEAGGIGFFSCDMAAGLTHWSETMYRLYGLAPSRPPPSMDFEGDHLGLIHPKDREGLRAGRASLAADASADGFAFEFRIRRADTGAVRWIDSRGEIVRDASGRIALVRGAQQDVTDRREAEQRLRLVANELNHRVKNTLATVQSIASQTLRGVDPGPREALEDRLLALSSAHDVLTREGWAGADMDEVVAGVLAPHGGREDGRFRVGGPAVRLRPRAALAVAMAL